MQKFSHQTQSFDGFTLDLTRGCLLRGSQEIRLPPKPFDALKYLVDNPGRLISKAELMTTLWPDTAVTDDSLVQCLMEVRRALNDDAQQIIKTVPRRGYIFDREVSVNAASPPVTTYTEESGELIIEDEETNGPPVIETRALPVAGSVALLPSQTELGFKRLTWWIYQHKLRVALTVVTLTVAASALVYFTRTGEAIDSVAVMPFVNVNGDPNTEYLSDGISDSIISDFSRLPSLKKVISFHSALRYKGKQTDPQAVGRELGVRAVLMGRVVQRGDDLSISIELIDVRDNRRLWGEQYSSKLSEILAVQGRIAREISERLRLRLTGDEQKQLAKHYTENAEAYQLYLLGRHYFHMQTKEGFEKSIEYYEQAIKADPNYALAYSGLSRAYHWMGTRGFWPAKESKQKVEWAALKALQLDDTLAEGHVRLGVLKFNNFDWAGAERDLKRALELDSNSPEANSAYFQFLAGLGRTDEALGYAIRAQELDATFAPGNLALAYLFARQFDKAIEVYRKEIEKNPESAHMRILLGEAYVAKGMTEEGVAEMQKGVALDPSVAKTPQRWDRYPMLAYAYAVAGRRSDALKILDAQHRLAKQRDDVSPYNFAIIYTGLGDKDQAFAWLEKCIEQRTPLVYRLKVRPMFDPLRSDPRYPELLRRMSLEP